MRLGILSDSHGNLPATRRAIEQLAASGAELLLHLGDIGDERVLDLFAGIPTHIVFGNSDDERALSRYATSLGLTVDHPMGLLEIDRRRLAFTHGHIEQSVAQALRSNVDYLIHGHTHKVRDERIGRTRVINPGALFRAAQYTVALLHPATDHVEWVEVAR